MSDLLQQSANVVGQSKAVTAAGAALAGGSGVFGFFSANTDAIVGICAAIGMIVAIAGFLVNLHFNRKRYELLKDVRVGEHTDSNP